MKKTLLLATFMLALFGTQLCAQLKVTNDGVIRLGSDITHSSSQKPAAYVCKTGAYEYGLVSYLTSDHDWGFALCGVANYRHDRQVGIKGDATNARPIYSGRSYGVMGNAGNCTPGYNYGVFGKLDGTNDGAAIFGTISDNVSAVQGRYAGYFFGDVYTNGNVSAWGFTNLSDANLKSNITNIGDDNLHKILKLTPVQYNWNKEAYDKLLYNTDDTLSIKSKESDIDASELHFGLLAQEVQKVFPQLVKSDGNGTLSVNYIELIPLLLQSVKDLSDEVQVLKDNMVQRSKAQSMKNDANGYEQAALYQNTPNPYSVSTTIGYVLPFDTKEAAIYIYDMNGLQLLKYDLTQMGEASITISPNSLQAGMYLYSLIADGNVIGTRQMILTK